MNEDEAREKECRAAGVGATYVGDTTLMRWDFPKCIASGCMMWRWSAAYKSTPLWHDRVDDDGDCGLKR